MKVLLRQPVKEDPFNVDDLFKSHDRVLRLSDVGSLRSFGDSFELEISSIRKIISDIEFKEPLSKMLGIMDLLIAKVTKYAEVLEMMLARYDTNMLFVAEYFMRKTATTAKWRIQDYVKLIVQYGSEGLVLSGIRVIELMTSIFERSILCAYKIDVGEFFFYLPAYKRMISLDKLTGNQSNADDSTVKHFVGLDCHNAIQETLELMHMLF